VSTPQITWDLTPLFQSISDPKIQQAISSAKTNADNFENKYRGKITTMSPEELLECLREIEAFETKYSNLNLYASLSFAADMTNPQTQTLHDKIDIRP
jgi:oligoendopeptidase F